MVDEQIREVLERAKKKNSMVNHIFVWADGTCTFCIIYSKSGIVIKSTETWKELVEFVDGDRILWRKF